MTPKERAAMQQALEALEDIFGKGKVDVGAITALREALAEPDMNLSCKSVQARLATSWGYVKADQAEPVAWMVYTADGQSVYVTDNPTDIKVGQRALPLYAAPVRTKDLTKTEMLTEAVEAGFMLHTGYGQGINKMMPVSDSATLLDFARAVIAADREKNK